MNPNTHRMPLIDAFKAIASQIILLHHLSSYGPMAVTARDFTKVVAAAEPVFYPEGGTDVERLAMAFHKVGKHPTTALKPDGSEVPNVSFITNGVGPVVGAPFHEPCRDDRLGDPLGHLTAGTLGQFFAGGGLGDVSTTGRSNFNATSQRIYKGVNIQFDAILNKVGYHYPQQRIITLWQDAVPVPVARPGAPPAGGLREPNAGHSHHHPRNKHPRHRQQAHPCLRASRASAFHWQ